MDFSDRLGPLPEQAGWCVLMHGHAASFASNAERAVGLSCGATTPLFTADQMRAYAAQEVAAERERCAMLCDEIKAKVVAHDLLLRGDISFGKAAGAEACAEAIRAR